MFMVDIADETGSTLDIMCDVAMSSGIESLGLKRVFCFASFDYISKPVRVFIALESFTCLAVCLWFA